MPAIAPLLRASVGSTVASNGHTSFVRPIRKLVIEYCERWTSSTGIRSFIAATSSNRLRTSGSSSPPCLETLARDHPSVEFIVRRRPHRHPVLRGLYINNRDKVICVRNLEPSAIAQKAKLLLDSSGDKLRKENRHPVQSYTESVRGIYSPFHSPYTAAENLGPLR